MILVLAGTADGREIVRRLSAGGSPVLATAVSEYGGELLRECPGARVLTGALDENALELVIKENQVAMLIDATHPYAEKISRMAEKTCEALGVKYFRYQRPAAEYADHPLIYRAATYTEAAEKAVGLAAELAAGPAGGEAARPARTARTVFLTTGSRNLRPFVEAAQKKSVRVAARVLPVPDVIADCLELGLKPQDIIACQGPFGEEMNRAMLAHYEAGVLVTKDSGTIGGTEAKLEAALAMNIPVVLVERPAGAKGEVAEDIEELIRMVLI